MTEQQKDYERIENEKFELLSFDCPWRNTPKIKGIAFCLATTEICNDSCAVWHFVRAMTR